MKSKIIPFFEYIAFFTQTCFFIFSLYLNKLSIYKENKHLFTILSIILFLWRDTKGFLQTSLINTVIWAIFLSLMPIIEMWKNIFFTLLLLATVILFLSQFGNILRQISLKTRLNVFSISLHISLSSMLLYTFTGKSKLIIGQSGSLPSINSCKKCPSWSESITSILSLLFVLRKFLGLTLLL
jgi:hypothetical protein